MSYKDETQTKKPKLEDFVDLDSLSICSSHYFNNFSVFIPNLPPTKIDPIFLFTEFAIAKSQTMYVQIAKYNLKNPIVIFQKRLIDLKIRPIFVTFVNQTTKNEVLRKCSGFGFERAVVLDTELFEQDTSQTVPIKITTVHPNFGLLFELPNIDKQKACEIQKAYFESVSRTGDEALLNILRTLYT